MSEPTDRVVEAFAYGCLIGAVTAALIGLAMIWAFWHVAIS